MRTIILEYDEDGDVVGGDGEDGVLGLGDRCPRCWPLGCDCSDAERPEAVPSRYTPLRNRGCHCGADYDGRDCCCWG